MTVALVVGSIELLQVLTGWAKGIDFEQLGYAIVGLFVLTWCASVAIWKGKRIEERWRPFMDE